VNPSPRRLSSSIREMSGSSSITRIRRGSDMGWVERFACGSRSCDVRHAARPASSHLYLIGR
jgi:hypothetical protein